nr:hypothetical protein [Exiguobacterium sp. SL14]
MKAVTVTGHGGLERLVYIDQETPQPKQGEVLIEIKACALNNTEIWMREGAYGAESESGWKAEGVKLPRIPGFRHQRTDRRGRRRCRRDGNRTRRRLVPVHGKWRNR